MCGITGIMAHNMIGQMHMIQLSRATETLETRGPDNAGYYTEGYIGLGHRRLSIIDTSFESNQPFTDASGRYVIIYNGELYNHKKLRHDLENKGYQFKSEGDTEVLLQAFIAYGDDFVKKLDGFFSFCIHDKELNSFFLGRDRFGIKPLLYYSDEDKFIFGSRLDTVLAFNVQKELDHSALKSYLRLNYIPSTHSIIQGVKKLAPGHTIRVSSDGVQEPILYYSIPANIQSSDLSYEKASSTLQELLRESVQNRLVSDVPIGTFLSGGIDSSIITKLAAEQDPNIQSFSVGFRGNKFFDESLQAADFAKSHNIQHHIFQLSEDDILSNTDSIIDSFDEPFADSSILAVNTLSKKVKTKITVALSGDGADEMFGGYNKHRAEFMALNPGFKEGLVSNFGWLWKILPQNRNSSFGNRIRQFDRFNSSRKLNSKKRYLEWASLGSSEFIDSVLLNSPAELELVKELSHFDSSKDSLRNTLLADMSLVLPSDMLHKVDIGSMAHSLEVRVPFLDHRIVNFAFGLPDSYKIQQGKSKRILKDSFSSFFTSDMLNRKKSGFEVPLRQWLLTEFENDIEKLLLDQDFLVSQNIFNTTVIKNLVSQLRSTSPSDSHANVWAILVFQKWWVKHFG
jgi:asparagine synthase (glutamine-hydrolysing)